MKLPSPSPEATHRFASALARVAVGGCVIGLVGPLGAGKTAFVKGLAEGLGIDPALVASPTFVIASEYPMPDGRRLVHADLYRLESVAELDATGFADLIGADAVVAVEWADRLPAGLPRDRLQVRIERSGDRPDVRVLHAEASGARSRDTLDAWRRELAADGEA